MSEPTRQDLRNINTDVRCWPLVGRANLSLLLVGEREWPAEAPREASRAAQGMARPSWGQP